MEEFISGNFCKQKRWDREREKIQIAEAINMDDIHPDASKPKSKVNLNFQWTLLRQATRAVNNTSAVMCETSILLHIG